MDFMLLLKLFQQTNLIQFRNKGLRVSKFREINKMIFV